MKRSAALRTVLGVAIIGGALCYFVYAAMQSSWAYYISVDELEGQRAALTDRPVRLAGTVAEGTIERQLEPVELRFAVAGASARFPVVYAGAAPENFEAGREVVIEGRLSAEGVFVAEQLMTRCESKYEAKLEGGE